MADEFLPLDASPARVAATVEGNLYALFRQIATLPDAELIETPRCSMHNAPFANPMFRGIWATRLRDEEAEHEIDAALDWFRQREAPYVFWWTGPETTPGDLAARLETRGFIPFEQDAPGMVAAIDTLDTEALRRVPDALTIEPVRDEASLDAFQQELVAAFGMPDWAAQSWSEATMAAGLKRAPWTLYLGRVAGQPVATAMLIEGGGVAGVLGIGVREAWRGRGIGAAVTLQPLLDAHARGYRHAALFATPLGEPVYARLGFRRCDVPISRYLWRGD